MIAVYSNDHETIVVGLNSDGSPMNPAGYDLEKFKKRFDIDTDKGQTVHIESTVGVRVREGTELLAVL